MRHVALLRGINVGGRHRLPMADVREALTGAGLGQVRTYIQSGNIVLDAPGTPQDVTAVVRERLEGLVDFEIPTIVLTGGELLRILADNPFTPDAPKMEHVVVLPTPVEADLERRLLELAEADDSPTELAIGAREVYLHHPEGLSQSKLATRATTALRTGTARNLATLQALADML